MSAVVHFEILGPAAADLPGFYAELFGWKIEPMPGMGYALVDTCAGTGIRGGVSTVDDARVMFYVEVPDLQGALDKAVSLGGSVVTEITEIPNVVTFAVLTDVAGNHVGVIQGSGSQEGPPPPSHGSGAPIEWFESVGPDGNALRDFYTDLFGWNIEMYEGVDYGHVVTPEGQISGGVGTSPMGRPVSLVYARVADLNEGLNRAEKLGGKRLTEPMKVDGDNAIAHFADPAGNMFGLIGPAI
ncbi:MAG: hypothetical protein NVSMB57_03440 [Actinomycetota bacterium]